MVFRLGSTTFKSGSNHRVTAHNNDGVVAVTLGHGVSRCLSASPGSKLAVTYGRKPGELYVTRSRGIATVDLYRNGTQLAFNVNADFLPVTAPDHGALPVRNYWRDVETLVLDFSKPDQTIGAAR